MNYSAINELFGTTFTFREMEQIHGLPLYMAAGRVFYEAVDGDLRFVLVHVAENERFGVSALERQAAQLVQAWNVPVAFGFDHLTKYQRDALVRRRIPFVAEGQQLYLPFLGMSLSNQFCHPVEESVEQMMPVTQSLFLYLLYECKGREVTKLQAAEALQVSKMSITRAARQLEAMGILSQRTQGRECYISTQETGYALFQQARPYLINPVQSVRTVERQSVLDELPLAGESALAGRSMLGEPRMVCVATSRTDAGILPLETVDERWSYGKDLVRVEIWRYDPARFMQNGSVDPVSLYLSLSENPDERIEGALEEMLEGYAW